MRSSVLSLLAIVAGVFLWAGPAHAASGTISAAPQTVVIPTGSSVGTTNISWWSTGSSSVHVTVSCNGGAESLFASSGAGSWSQSAPWITVGSSCTFRLRALTVSGPLLSWVTVTGVAPPQATGTINANPTTVIIPSTASTGTTNVTWTSSNTSTVYVKVSCNGGGEGLFASSGPGTWSQSAPWITAGSSCSFRLRNGTVDGPLLASVTVTGIAGVVGTGTLAANPPHVPVPRNAGYGFAKLRWTSNLASVELRRVQGGVETSLGTFAGSGELSSGGVQAGLTYQYRLYGNGQLLATSASIAGVRLKVATRGGSNHVFHRYPPPGSSDIAYNHGVVLHYHEAGVRDRVRGQLRQMHDNGQRALRVMVWFAHAPGEVITTSPAESSRKCDLAVCGPNDYHFLPRQFQTNLANHLADIRAAGFERVTVALGPQWVNDFIGCNSLPPHLRSQMYAGSPYVNELFEEAWGVLRETRTITAAAGLPYLIDLSNEYVPPSNLEQGFGTCAKDLVEGKPSVGFAGYLRFLWGRYVATYGNTNTVGFSVIVGNSWDADNRLARMPTFLSPLPPVLSLHSYTSGGDIRGGLDRAWQISQGWGARPWIIGETDNRSTSAAAAISGFLSARAQEILYVMQWPGFNCATEATCLPLDYTAFSAQGL